MKLSSLTVAVVISMPVCQAFTTPTLYNALQSLQTRSIQSSDQYSNTIFSSSSNDGWDNDSFMDALGSGTSAIDQANQAYQKESTNRSAMRNHRLQSLLGDESNAENLGDGAQVIGSDDAIFGGQVSGMPDKPPKAPPIDEDNPSGGTKFRKLMERAKQGPNRPKPSFQEDIPPPPPSPSTEQQQPLIPTPPPANPVVPPAVPAVGAVDPQIAYYAVQLETWQQQMIAFAQLSASNPEAAASMTMPPPPPPPQALSGMAQTYQPQPYQQQPTAPLNADGSLQDYAPKPSSPAKFNKDAYEIVNEADVYLAQLKRDSSERNKLRQSGHIEESNKVFADEGVKALKSFLPEELIAQRKRMLEENGGEFTTSRDEMLVRYEDENEDLDKTSSGVNYKQKLAEMKKNKRGGAGVTAAATTTTTPPPPPPPPAEPAFKIPSVKPIAPIEPPQPQVAASTITSTPEPPTTATPIQEEEEAPAPTENAQQFALQTNTDLDTLEPVRPPSTQDSEEARRSMRTLMGLILKHRGGPGFGKGLLNGPDATRLESTLDEVMSVLKEEAGIDSSSPTTSTDSIAAAPAAVAEGGGGDYSPLTGAFACIEGAIALYKSSPSSGQNELLKPLRDALLSASTTIDGLINDIESNKVGSTPPPVIPEPSTPSVAETAPAATTIPFPQTYEYQVAPASEDVAEEEAKEVAKVEENIQQPSLEESLTLKDDNTAKLQEIYDKLRGMKGDSKYGLPEDMNQEEIAHISEVLKEMRVLLMEELDLIPQPSYDDLSESDE